MGCYVYVLGCRGADRALTYVGWTVDLDARLARHNAGAGAKSTRGRRWELLYAERLPSKTAAMSREWRLKRDRAFRRQLRACAVTLWSWPTPPRDALAILRYTRGKTHRLAAMILIIDNYDSFTYNLVHYLEELGAAVAVERNDSVTAEEALSSNAAGIVLSPGPCTPNEAGICLDLLKRAPENLPILGVCLGHQAIGQAFGGVVESAMEIRHGKVSTVHQYGGDLFLGVPETFEAVRYHSLAIRRKGMPNVLKVDAETSDGEIMAVSHAHRPIWGVQFHPESIGSQYGKVMLGNFLRRAEMGR